MPSLADMQIMAESAYTGKTRKQVGSFELFYATPTLKFYKDDKIIIVSIRGTQDQRDFSSWPNVAFGTLNNSARFQADLQTLIEVQKSYPQTEYYYVGVGHSLGAAIMDRFIAMGLIKTGLSYNGAVEPQFVKQNSLHRRIYNAADPLYNIVGRFIPGVEVRPISLATGIRGLFSSLYASYKSHMLSNFKGGAAVAAAPSQYTEGLTPAQKKEQIALIKQSQEEYAEGKVEDRPRVSEKPTRRSKHVVKFEKKYGFPITDLKKIKATFPDTDIDKILSKGAGAYGSSGSRPNVSVAQWAYARLASVLTGGPSLRIDKDLVGPVSLEKIR
jgi:hypothetical protein